MQNLLSTFASMKLIADSGSTKTTWVLADGVSVVCKVGTAGINPVVQTEDAIMSTLGDLVSSLPSVPQEVFFYGAGCRGEASLRMSECLRKALPDAMQISVESDLLGAARALFGNDEGIACILGTGSNSCLYDGKCIVNNIPPLGYILGDEGSGAVMGKMFFNAMFKGDLPDELKKAYLDETSQTYDDVMRRVYREPNANRYLASTSLFISKHITNKTLADIVEHNIDSFFIKNVCNYGRQDLPVGAVGSIAFAYSDIYNKVAVRHGYRVSTIIKEPIESLLDFHTGK